MVPDDRPKPDVDLRKAFNPVWTKGEGFKIIHNQGSWDTTSGCRQSEEFDPVNLDLLVARYNENSFSKALVYKNTIIHVYGAWYNFQKCIEWAQTEKYINSKDYKAKFPLFPQAGYIGNEEFPEPILTKAQLLKLIEGL